jgi:hypothetical protein
MTWRATPFDQSCKHQIDQTCRGQTTHGFSETELFEPNWIGAIKAKELARKTGTLARVTS